MAKPTSAVKRKYNKSAYERHEFSVGVGTLLAHKISEYKQDNSLSALVKDLLAAHFGIYPDELYVPYYLKRLENGETVKVPNPDEKYKPLDKKPDTPD